MLVAMKVPVTVQPYVNPISPSIGTSPADAASSSNDGLFSDLLQNELAGGQRVVTAEQITAELDGTPDWGFLRDFTSSANNAPSTGAGSAIPSKTIMEKIDRTAKTIGVDEDLVREVVRAESNFNPNAVSHAGAKGLMQLMDGTARAMQVKDVYNPDENLAGGTKYLKSLLDRYDGNVKVALAAYNAGPGRVSRLGIKSDEDLEAKYDELPQETQRYVEKIMNRL